MERIHLEAALEHYGTGLVGDGHISGDRLERADIEIVDHRVRIKSYRDAGIAHQDLELGRAGLAACIGGCHGSLDKSISKSRNDELTTARGDMGDIVAA